jgi:predicted porin
MGINMKKTLLRTTFLATAGLLAFGAGDAFAQAAAPAAEKMKISVGGFMLQTLGWADQDSAFERETSGYKSFDTKSDSEVHFKGSLVLDNGLTVAVVAEMEADVQTSGGSVQMDESYLTIGSTTLGTLLLGSADGAGSALNVQAPWTGALNPYTGDMPAWVIDPGGVADDISISQNAGGSNDDNIIRYISPTLFGFRAGLSYASSQTDSSTQPTVTETDQWEGGLQFSEKFGDFAVRASGIYWRTNAATLTTDLDGWAIGADVTFADFTFGGGYGEANQDGATLAAATTAADTDTWNVGLKYAPGPWEVAFTYGRQKAKSTAADTDDDTHSRWILGGRYTLGPGVTLQASAIRLAYDVEADNATLENDGWAVVGGIQVDF